MNHLGLFYNILTYTLGFSILVLSIYKFITTKNHIVGAFIFLWCAMTALIATYVINTYIYVNLEFYMDYFIVKLHYLAILLTSIAVPVFVHTVFNIKRKIPIFIVAIVSIILSIMIIAIRNDTLYIAIIYSVMIVITLSNIYSVLTSLAVITTFERNTDKKSGFLFILLYIVLFLLLFLIDIMSVVRPSPNPIAFFPIFYTCIGCTLAYIGFKKLNITGSNVDPMDVCINKLKLTKRQSEIALLLINGLTYKEIAEKLFISSGTVSTHVKHIYEKTGTSSKIQLNKEIFK